MTWSRLQPDGVAKSAVRLDVAVSTENYGLRVEPLADLFQRRSKFDTINRWTGMLIFGQIAGCEWRWMLFTMSCLTFIFRIVAEVVPITLLQGTGVWKDIGRV